MLIISCTFCKCIGVMVMVSILDRFSMIASEGMLAECVRWSLQIFCILGRISVRLPYIFNTKGCDGRTNALDSRHKPSRILKFQNVTIQTNHQVLKANGPSETNK